MPLDTELESISGANALYEWFGYWPTFHDAELQEFHLNLNGTGRLKLHTWEMSKQVDAKGHYVLTKHTLVELSLQKIHSVSLQEFFDQGIIFDLLIKKMDNGFQLDISSSYGLHGTIDAGNVAIQLIPWEPPPQN